MADQTENVYIKLNIDTKGFDGSLTGIKKEMAALRGQIGSSLISKEDNAILSARFGKLKDDMADLKLAAGNINTADVFGNMARLGGIAASSVSSVVGVTSLLGVESKKVAEIEKQMLTLISVASTLQQIADLKREKGLITEYGLMIKNALLFKGEQVLKAQSLAQTEALTVAQAFQTKGVGLATKAQLVWNAAISANPIGLLVVAVAALVAGIYLLVKAFETNTESVKSWEKALDGAVIADDELRKSHNESIIALQDLQVEYLLTTGVIDEYGAETIRINNEITNSTSQMSKDMDEELSKIQEKYDGFWHSILVGLKSAIIGQAAYAKDIADRLIEESLVREKYRVKEEDAQKIADKKREIAQINHENKISKSITDYRVARLKDTISALNSEYDALVQSEEKILGLYRDLAGRQKELRERSLTPEQKELQAIDDFYNQYIEGSKNVQRQLEKEKDNLKKIEIQISANEKLLKKYLGAEKEIGSELTKQQQDSISRLNQIVIEELNASNAMKESLNSLQGVSTSTEAYDLILEDIEKAQNRINQLDNERNAIEQNLSDLSIKQLNASKERLSLESELNNLQVKKLDTEQRVNDLIIEQNKIRLQVSKDDPNVLAKKQAEERKNVENKYATERLLTSNKIRQQLVDDEITISKIRSDGYQSIIDNERTSNTARELAIKERNKEIEKQINYNKELIELQKIEIQLEIDLVNLNKSLTIDEKAQQIEQLTSSLKVSIEKTNEAIRSLLTSIETPPKLNDWQQWVKDFNDNWANLSMSEKINEIAQMSAFVLDQVSQVANAIIEKNRSIMLAQLEIDLNDIQTQFDETIKGLDSALKYGVISQENYNKQSLDAEKKRAAEEKSLKTEAARMEQKWAISQAIMSTALAVLNGLATQPLVPVGLLMAATAAAVGAIQISTIKNTPLPVFAKGGYIDGQSHSQGGTMVNAEAGEFIVNKKSAQAPNMRPVLESINAGTYQQIQPFSIEDLRTVVAEMASIPVINVESDTTRVQRRVSNIESQAKW